MLHIVGSLGQTVLSLFLYQILRSLGTSVTGCFVFIPALKLSQSNMPQSINLVSQFLQWVVVTVDEITFEYFVFFIKMEYSKITKFKQCYSSSFMLSFFHVILFFMLSSDSPGHLTSLKFTCTCSNICQIKTYKLLTFSEDLKKYTKYIKRGCSKIFLLLRFLIHHVVLFFKLS